MMTVGSDLKPSHAGRHQADGVAGEQRQVLGVQEERRGHQVGGVTSRSVGEQQVTAVQRGDGDCAARCQCLNGSQSAVAHESRAQCTAQAARSQTEEGTPGHTKKIM